MKVPCYEHRNFELSRKVVYSKSYSQLDSLQKLSQFIPIFADDLKRFSVRKIRPAYGRSRDLDDKGLICLYVSQLLSKEKEWK